MAFRPISSPRFIRVSRSFPEDAKGRPVRLIPEIFIGFFRSRTMVCRPSCRAAVLRLVATRFCLGKSQYICIALDFSYL